MIDTSKIPTTENIKRQHEAKIDNTVQKEIDFLSRLISYGENPARTIVNDHKVAQRLQRIFSEHGYIVGVHRLLVNHFRIEVWY